MNSFLLNRQLGSISPAALSKAQNDRLLRSLQPAPKIHFARQRADDVISKASQSDAVSSARSVAHSAGVNSISVDKFEGRYLLSGGADSSVAIWDLESEAVTDYEKTYLPLDSAARYVEMRIGTKISANIDAEHLRKKA